MTLAATALIAYKKCCPAHSPERRGNGNWILLQRVISYRSMITFQARPCQRDSHNRSSGNRTAAYRPRVPFAWFRGYKTMMLSASFTADYLPDTYGRRRERGGFPGAMLVVREGIGSHRLLCHQVGSGSATSRGTQKPCERFIHDTDTCGYRRLTPNSTRPVPEVRLAGIGERELLSKSDGADESRFANF